MAFTISRRQALLFSAAAGAAAAAGTPALADANALLNVSFDPTAQLYAAYDKLFAATGSKKPA